MMTSTEILNQFYAALERYADEYGRGFKAYLNADGCCTASYAGYLLRRKRRPSKEMQIAIAKACGMEYENFLKYGETETKPKQDYHLKAPPPGILEIKDKLIASYEDQIHGLKDEITRLKKHIADLESRRLGEPRATELPNGCPSCKREAS
jgi:transcriptional regulator with XRE-family HTH domain